jgi:hypothetical protein
VMWLQRVKAAEIDGEVFATSWLEALAEGAGRRLCIPGYVAVCLPYELSQGEDLGPRLENGQLSAGLFVASLFHCPRLSVQLLDELDHLTVTSMMTSSLG